MTTETILAGFGGQGILFAGKLLAYLGLNQDKQVSWLPSYGPEMRGGTANCSVCLSDHPIGSPYVTDPDVLIAMNSPSFDKFINTVKPGGIAIIDSTLVTKECTRSDIRSFRIPSTELAAKNGIPGMANIILVGKLLKETGISMIDTVRPALEKLIPAKKANLIEANMKALALGMSL
ncbi:MAG: 2-oxoacid:acceptor oxidoreductase family protein [Oscillospiraceae bacterium]